MLRPRLIVITDSELVPRPELEARVTALASLARPGSVLVQLRDRTLPARERLELGRHLAKLARDHGQLFAVNDALDLARLLAADALHLGEHSVSTADARALLGSIWISRACHDPAAAGVPGADAVLLSPVFAPRKGAAALGLEGLRLALRHARGRPEPGLVYALGGVTPEHAQQALRAGADGVAAIAAALVDPDPIPLLEALGIRSSS
ncbi:MAG TPA: thiamine phosphate synthase [Polyangiaceae bacterium]